MVSGGAGLVLGKIASIGAEHQHHESTLYEEHWQACVPRNSRGLEVRAG
jgi:hypothetical protein